MTLDDEFRAIVTTVANASSLEECALAIESSRWNAMLECVAVYARLPDVQLDEFKERFAGALGHDRVLDDD